jgi:predicted transposase YbfD/YdcC
LLCPVFLDGLGEDGPGVIAIDGKTLRRSFDRATGRSPLNCVTAFVADARMVIGQVAAGDKESEITAARTLLGLIDLTSAVVMDDALHCQGETARLIKDRGGDSLFTLKANRPLQHAEVRAWFADPASRPDSEHTTTDAESGRIKVRRHAVSHDVLAMLGMVEATVKRDGKTTTVRRHYLCSVTMDAVRFAAAVRAHSRIKSSKKCSEAIIAPSKDDII